MRRRTAIVLAAGVVALTAGTIARIRRTGSRSEPLPPHEAIFTVFAPGGKQAYWCNGPVGRVTARLIPILEKDVYEAAAQMLDLRSDDTLLDIGSGPGSFLATKAAHVRSVVGIDPSPLMRHEAERRLADRIAAGTARIVPGSADSLPFDDGEFSAVSAIFAPIHHEAAYRVLCAGGRLVVADQDPRKSMDERPAAWGVRRYTEADHRKLMEDAGFEAVSTRMEGGYLVVEGHKPLTAEQPASLAGVAAAES